MPRKKRVNVKDLDAILEEGISNIRNDRSKADLLLMELVQYLKGNAERNEKVGAVAAKYLETLQRSNEQLVKIAELARKRLGSVENTELTKEDKEALFDEINLEKQED